MPNQRSFQILAARIRSPLYNSTLYDVPSLEAHNRRSIGADARVYLLLSLAKNAGYRGQILAPNERVFFVITDGGKKVYAPHVPDSILQYP